ncbi:MAG TPA: hypothetical protein VEX68_05000 [Bryobacteraceae bacterium]|nr:hypothetical protein [Bryobacteraceae bacterium]
MGEHIALVALAGIISDSNARVRFFRGVFRMIQKLNERINKLPKWARDYLHHVHTFIGAPEVGELIYLRDQNKALITVSRGTEGGKSAASA